MTIRAGTVHAREWSLVKLKKIKNNLRFNNNLIKMAGPKFQPDKDSSNLKGRALKLLVLAPCGVIIEGGQINS